MLDWGLVVDLLIRVTGLYIKIRLKKTVLQLGGDKSISYCVGRHYSGKKITHGAIHSNTDKILKFS